jgi:hypothetical protein
MTISDPAWVLVAASSAKTKPGLPWAIWSHFVRITSGEWMLDKHPNGGDIILARALLITLLITMSLLELMDLSDSTRVFAFRIDWQHLTHLFLANLGLVGGVFAASYTALYARFSSQWNYLANLYNQQMQVGISSDAQICESDEAADTYDRWCAAFVEDAWCLHLARKKMFAEAICQMLERKEVAAYVKNSLEDDFEKLVLAVGMSFATVASMVAGETQVTKDAM